MTSNSRFGIALLHVTFFHLWHVQKKIVVFRDHRTAKERARFLADFAVNVKEPQLKCALKSAQSFELLDSPNRYHVYLRFPNSQDVHKKIFSLLANLKAFVTRYNGRAELLRIAQWPASAASFLTHI